MQPTQPCETSPCGPPDSGTPQRRRWYRWPGWFLARLLNVASLLVLLSITAAIPVIQLASLGYILRGAGNLAAGRGWRSAMPGLSLAGRCGAFALLAAITWLPVAFIADLAYSAQLLQPGARSAKLWRLATFAVAGSWVVYVAWAAIRGGRWWHFAWPAPVRFLRNARRPTTWSDSLDQLLSWAQLFQFPQLWWLGARATAGALLWTAIPVFLMILGQRGATDGAGLYGLLGATLMVGVFFYLPFLQLQLATTDRFRSMFNVVRIRREFGFAPLAYALGLLVLGLLCMPLYLLRVEMPPSELRWAISLVFVLMMLPAKWALGASVGYSLWRRTVQQRPPRHWSIRWAGRLIALATALAYVGTLYLGQLIADQGAMGMYFQHAFLAPAPL